MEESKSPAELTKTVGKTKFSVILEEQTPVVSEMEDPESWIKENSKLIDEFFLYSKQKQSAVGLAANQLSMNGERFMERMFCSKAKGEGDGDWRVFINPKIVKNHGVTKRCVEGCLTWPKKKVIAQRYRRIDVEWWNPDGTKEAEELTGWEAQVWQHEQDHLDGIEEEIVENDHFTLRSTKVPRNAPCPCGKMRDNGKPYKYKQCCG
jgi:peptide deformylase